jgi:aromatic-L-amino-acid decarboxylase
LGRRCLRFALDQMESAATLPASDLSGVERLAGRKRRPVPRRGRPLSELLEILRRAIPKSLTTTGPGYLAYIPGGGLPAAAFADLIACAANRFTNRWHAAPALVELESDVLRWLLDLFDYPPQARGILTSGGSMANLSAIVAARHARLGRRFERGTIYFSDQIHHSVAKAAQIVGLAPAALRTVPSDARFKLDIDALERMLRSDRRRGRRPFLLVASAGTINTGAIDPIRELAALARDQGLWLHIDGAYGGFFQLTEPGRRAFAGIGRADSITLDPHKGMFLPYGTGCLLVREGEALRRAHCFDADYLQDLHAPPGSLSFADYSPELSRDYRGLRVWLPLYLHGTDAFRAALEEKLELARWAYQQLAATAGFECLGPPELSTVAFRYRPRRGTADAFNRRLLERANRSRRLFISSTRVRGRLTLRLCILSFRTHFQHVERAVRILQSSARSLDR